MCKRLGLLLMLALMIGFGGAAAAGLERNGTAVDVDEIGAFVESEMARGGIPGLALAVVRGDQVVYLQGYGRADDDGRPVTPQTPFTIGSISKTFTALAIHQLAADGRIELNALVQRYLPDFTLADAEAAAHITVQQLLDHTSGLPKSAGEEAYQLDPQYTTAELVAQAAVVPNRPAGESYEYCNLNYLLLGMVIERVSGESYTAYVREHVWQPLEMEHSYFSEAEAVGLATGYRTLFGLRFPYQATTPPGMIPSGYGISTAEDLSHLAVAYLNAGKYRQASVLDSASYYDIYWNRLVGATVSVETSQSGGTLNFNGDIHLLPGRGVGVVVLTNTRHLWDSVLPVTTAASIASGIAYRVAGERTPALPAMSLWQSYWLLDGVALLLLSWAWFRLWRFVRPGRSIGPWRWHPPLAMLLDGSLGLLLLAGVPLLANQHWDYLLTSQPDLAGVAFAAGVLLTVSGMARAMHLLIQRSPRLVSGQTGAIPLQGEH